ncbi:acyl-CoA dehydrogenase/oxidase [Schizothecium vesticola]|uniref:Acyl-CoA dehydrogenase/oxidase n=1 Tax=Schizothecium vesticola TaxID=314040 RepID=A0AA40FBA5_9PEZI|nr:acyl-CoA dehydrogenase/oxidase [Schizothecium vesticola]
MEPSSANKGFIQAQPVLRNQFHEDATLQRVIKLFLPLALLNDVSAEISLLADEVLSPQIFDWVTDAERNLPYLRGNGRDAFGRSRSDLVVTEGWRKLQEFGLKKGMVALNYDTDRGEYTRLVQFIRCHLWGASCANTLCPAAMQDGAARLLQRHLAGTLSSTERLVFQDAYDHLTSRDPSHAWTSGQWMTERTGGSDVSRTETIATLTPIPTSAFPSPIPLGPWSVSGFKWFSSATDSQMTILLARTSPSAPVSAFFAPTRIPSPTGTTLNGITIQRLKSKLGTHSLPTAELELNDTRAWLIGREGAGIPEISTILTITRVHTTVSSLSYLGRGLAVARSFALVREVGVGRSRRVPLSFHPLHMRTLANLTGDYHTMMLLTFFTVFLLGLDERRRPSQESTQRPAPALPAGFPPPPQGLVAPLLRVLSSLHKSYVCELVVPAMFTTMQALGGVGYLVSSETEPINVARLFRDACVGAIWEGTTDVLAGDTVRALKHARSGGEVREGVAWLVRAGLGLVQGGQWEGVKREVERGWETLKGEIEKGTMEGLLPGARRTAFRLAELMIAVLFLVDLTRNPGKEAEVMCWRWMEKKGFVPEGAVLGIIGGVEMDQRIVYGPGGVVPALGGGAKL